MKPIENATSTQAIKKGYFYSQDGETLTKWAVFSREQYEQARIESLNEFDAEYLEEMGDCSAEYLTGWYEFQGRAGQWFGYAPRVRFIGSRKVLVSQYLALDI